MTREDRITAIPSKIRDLSTVNPFVHQAITAYLHMPAMTTEELLTNLVLILASENDRYKQKLIDHMSREPLVWSARIT